MTKRGFKATTADNLTTEADTNQPASAPAATSWVLLQQSPKLFWDNLVPAFMVVILPSALLQLGALLVGDSLLINPWTIAGVIFQLTALTLLLWNVSASPYLQVHSLRGEQVGTLQMYRQSKRYWLRIVGFSLLFGLLFVGGLLLLIVPGLIILRRYILVPFFIVEEDLGIREAMQRSAAATKPDQRYVWTTIGVLVVLAGIGILFSRLPQPWSAMLNALAPAFYFYLLGLRYRDARRNVVNDGAFSTLR